MKYIVELEEKDWDAIVDALGFLHGRMEVEKQVEDYYKARFGRSDLKRVFEMIQKQVGKDMS